MKRRKTYESPASLQQVEVLLELAFVASDDVSNSLNDGGIFSDTQDIDSYTDSDFDGWR